MGSEPQGTHMLRLSSLSVRCAIVVCSLAALSPLNRPLAAQNPSGTLAGTVTNKSGRAMAGVVVQVSSPSISASTNTSGQFRVGRLAPGRHQVQFRYLGYSPVTREVDVAADKVTSLDAVLEEVATQLKTVRISGQLAGQAAALNQQRTAVNISSVVDNQMVGRLPDQNLAEAVQRLPGVAIDRDQGEGRYVQIRGMRQDLNSLSINGER